MVTLILSGAVVILLTGFVTAWLLKGNDWDQPHGKPRNLQARRGRR